MSGNAAKVGVTQRQADILADFSKSKSVAISLALRASIVPLAFEGLDKHEIASRVGLNRLQFGLWRRRWRDNWVALTLLECRVPLKLREAIREVFRDAPRRGCLPRITADQLNQIQALAANRLVFRIGPFRIGPLANCATKSSNGASSTKSPSRRSVAICVGRRFRRIVTRCGSTPPRKCSDDTVI